MEYGLLFHNGSRSEGNELIGYLDGDWYGGLTDNRSTSGYVFNFNDAAISWCIEKQLVIALSSCKDEYVAGNFATCQTLWLDSVMKELKCEIVKPVTLRIDNKSIISLTKNSIRH